MLLVALFSFFMHFDADPGKDINEMLVQVVDNQHVLELLNRQNRGDERVCIITNGHMPKPTGELDARWSVAVDEDAGDISCLDMTRFTRDKQKVRMEFAYKDYKIKAKFRQQKSGEWRRTSLSIRGRGTSIIDKTF